MDGQIIDASIVYVPTQHNSRDENKTIKAGEMPDDLADKPAQAPPERHRSTVDKKTWKKPLPTTLKAAVLSFMLYNLQI